VHYTDFRQAIEEDYGNLFWTDQEILSLWSLSAKMASKHSTVDLMVLLDGESELAGAEGNQAIPGSMAGNGIGSLREVAQVGPSDLANVWHWGVPPAAGTSTRFQHVTWMAKVQSILGFLMGLHLGLW